MQSLFGLKALKLVNCVYVFVFVFVFDISRPLPHILGYYGVIVIHADKQ